MNISNKCSSLIFKAKQTIQNKLFLDVALKSFGILVTIYQPMWHKLPGVINCQKRSISRKTALRKKEYHENILCLENTMFRVYCGLENNVFRKHCIQQMFCLENAALKNISF
jgi:hypothetical protein